MLTILILLVLLYAYYAGRRRGLMLQLVYTAGYLISFIFARLLYRSIAPKLTLWVPYQSADLSSRFAFFSQKTGLKLDNAFYAACAFMLVLVIGWVIVRFVGVLVSQLTFYPLEQQTSMIGGGVLNVLTVYVGIFLILTLLALLPIAGLQTALAHSILARGMVKLTPIPAIHWWLQAI
ncbi:colicin V production protein CvpA [Loigolactobacillus backii]|uniref:CvpA family protein n=1 Tax=Loigolactobacillus backii TaxID=375175 RepID=UPI000C1C8719|nr:CvpA family protein [Loigolactobacillus backii]PIO83090.1 colicin V production protein CvpA [Loigolactobacillus backii]